jgi:hypothetical protein
VGPWDDTPAASGNLNGSEVIPGVGRIPERASAGNPKDSDVRRTARRTEKAAPSAPPSRSGDGPPTPPSTARGLRLLLSGTRAELAELRIMVDQVREDLEHLGTRVEGTARARKACAPVLTSSRARVDALRKAIDLIEGRLAEAAARPARGRARAEEASPDPHRAEVGAGPSKATEAPAPAEPHFDTLLAVSVDLQSMRAHLDTAPEALDRLRASPEAGLDRVRYLFCMLDFIEQNAERRVRMALGPSAGLPTPRMPAPPVNAPAPEASPRVTFTSPPGLSLSVEAMADRVNAANRMRAGDPLAALHFLLSVSDDEEPTILGGLTSLQSLLEAASELTIEHRAPGSLINMALRLLDVIDAQVRALDLDRVKAA